MDYGEHDDQNPAPGEVASWNFEVPEVLYDLDHAGHYFRRIKSASISLPCIVDPYTSVSAKLTLESNKYRNNLSVGSGYAEDLNDINNPDPRFTRNIGSLKTMSTSTAQNNSGVFELNFRNERYLPFEGCVAISGWKLELPNEVRQFDYNTITAGGSPTELEKINDDLNLLQASRDDIELGMPFKIAVEESDLDKLERLTLFVKYGF